MRRGVYAFHVLAHSIVGTIPTIFFIYAPGTRAGLCAKEAKPPREALLLFSAGSAEGLWHSTPDLLPLRNTLRPALRSLLFSSFRTGGESTTTLRLRGACGASLFVDPGVSPRGETPAGDRVSGHFTDMCSNYYPPNALWRHAKTTEGPERKAELSFTPSR
jgi:hypothetical protein